MFRLLSFCSAGNPFVAEPNVTLSSKGRIANIMAEGGDEDSQTNSGRCGTVSRNRQMWVVKKWEQLIFWRDAAAGCEMNSAPLLNIGENSMSLPFYPGFVSFSLQQHQQQIENDEQKGRITKKKKKEAI